MTRQKIIKIFIIIFIIAILIGTFEFFFARHIIISKNIEINIPLSAKVESIDTHGGLHMDGEMLAKVYFTDRQAEKMIEKIKINEHWRELPMMEKLQEVITFNTDKSMKFPIIENGYWFYLDRHTEADNKYDEYERYKEERYSTNYSVAVYDIDSNVLYYYELDT